MAVSRIRRKAKRVFRPLRGGSSDALLDRFRLKPETRLEARILSDETVRKALDFGKPRPGHPEGEMGHHVNHILAFIEVQCVKDPAWHKNREALRQITLLHDVGKVMVDRSKRGEVRGDKHQVFSWKFARQFVKDERILDVIRVHDDSFYLMKKLEKTGTFDEKWFRESFSNVDKELLVQFMYSDNCDRPQANKRVEWFVQTCRKLGI